MLNTLNGQLVFGFWQRDDRRDLGKVRVGRRAREKMDTLVARLGWTVDQPGATPLTAIEAARLRSFAHRHRSPTAAGDDEVVQAGARALLAQPHRLLARRTTVEQPSPIQVLEVPVRTSTDEADRGHPVLLVRLVAELCPCPLVQVAPLNDPPRAPFSPTDHRRFDPVRDEPGREHQDIDVPRVACREIGGDRRFQETDRPPLRQLLSVAQQLGQPLDEGGFVDRLRRVREPPDVETADEHRAIRQVHHGPGAEGRDQLALAEHVGLLAHRRSSRITRPRGSRRRSVTLASTSRIDLGATNASSSGGSGVSRAGSSGTCRSGFAPEPRSV